jgi:catechol-2,3-dioxygenase
VAVSLGWPTWIGVVVEDLEAQRRFYGGVLGFRPLESGTDWVQFDLGEERILELVRRSERPQYDRLRYQVGFAVPDIDAARQELIARGVEPISELEGSGRRWCYFRDPEGNVFELKKSPL